MPTAGDTRAIQPESFQHDIRRHVIKTGQAEDIECGHSQFAIDISKPQHAVEHSGGGGLPTQLALQGTSANHRKIRQ